MTEETAAKPAESQEKVNGKPFKKGYDERRWLKGRGKKSADQKKGEEILRAVIWDELSREFNATTGKMIDDEDTVDALRMMVRAWMRKRPGEIADRIAGKVAEHHELTGKGGEPVRLIVEYTDKPQKDNNA